MKTIWIKENPLNNIISGKKLIEGRLNKGLFKNLKVNELITLSCKSKSCKVKIINIIKCNNFNDLLSNYNLNDILPDARNIAEGLEIYNKIYTIEKEYKFGVLGLYIEVI